MAAIPFSTSLRESFDNDIPQSDWPDVLGADVTDICDPVVSGAALTFYKVSMGGENIRCTKNFTMAERLLHSMYTVHQPEKGML